MSNRKQRSYSRIPFAAVHAGLMGLGMYNTQFGAHGALFFGRATVAVDTAYLLRMQCQHPISRAAYSIVQLIFLY